MSLPRKKNDQQHIQKAQAAEISKSKKSSHHPSSLQRSPKRRETNGIELKRERELNLLESLEAEYISFLDRLKERIIIARQRAMTSANQELISLYYQIGIQIVQTQKELGWGAKVIDRISKDLRTAFPEVKGFSTTNLKYMKLLAETFNLEEIAQYGVDTLPWFHLITILVDCKNLEERRFYINKTIELGWSRNVLSMQIEANLYSREGRAMTNFHQRLPSPQSDLAHAALRNPYIFEFLALDEKAQERQIESSLIDNIEKFLLELGEGFAFIGRQYHLQIEDQDFYIDLLFYHVKLHCYVVVELKTGSFKPEFAGKMNFYLSAVDSLLKQPEDNGSIGLILCRSKMGVVAEYALRDMSKPIGLAEYRVTNSLPERLKAILPPIEKLEAQLE
jgi:predicted nuclease of restriction endonuclease-like (RecB) superfamily